MERTVAKCLLEIKAIFFGFDDVYIGKKGQRLPLYCDNRIVLSYPRVRKVLAKWLTNVVKEKYPDAQMIVGTSIPGISIGLLVGEMLGLPITYILDGKMKYAGYKNVNQIIAEGTKVVVVDDVICTGETIIDVVDSLREIKAVVLGGVSLFSYELEDTVEKLKQRDITYYALTNYDVVTLIGQQTGKITYNQYLQALQFKKQPFIEEWN